MKNRRQSFFVGRAEPKSIVSQIAAIGLLAVCLSLSGCLAAGTGVTMAGPVHETNELDSTNAGLAGSAVTESPSRSSDLAGAPSAALGGSKPLPSSAFSAPGAQKLERPSVADLGGQSLGTESGLHSGQVNGQVSVGTSVQTTP